MNEAAQILGRIVAAGPERHINHCEARILEAQRARAGR